jgi:hypothetical protein
VTISPPTQSGRSTTAQSSEAPPEPWGWNRRQRIALGILLLIFLACLVIQFARHPARLDDPVVTYNGSPVELPARIDPNTATLQELSRIPHMGEAIATRILQYRDAHKSIAPDGIVFHEPSDLDAIPGVGKKLIEQIEPFLAFPGDIP